jgi:hypothetical protein
MRFINGIDPPPLPRYSSVAAGTQPDQPDPPPAAPAVPFPGEPGDVPQPADVPRHDPEPEKQAPYDPGPQEPMPQAAVADPLAQLLDKLTDRAIYAGQSRHRFELAFVATLVGCQGTLSFVHNAVGKLDVSDWQGFPDLAIDLRRQARELSEQLDPICAALEKAKPPRLTAVS